jgi:NAD(P)-dependent dehydrogenase (short-subunit alcohol dehydrogenase family)
MDLSGRVAIVTGSSRGFGEKIAETLNNYGGQTVVTYLRDDNKERVNAENVAKRIKSDLVLPLDVTDRKSVKNVMRQAYDRFGKIDILVNNAGINIVGDFDKISDEAWQAVIDVDLKGAFICCQEILPYLSNNGRVINIGSVSGQYGGPRTPSYAAAKAGVMALTHCFARFVGGRNITVNCVSPGTIQSEMLDTTMPEKLRTSLLPMVLLKRMGKVEEVAETVAFLSSDGAGYITGQTIAVNGGLWV